MCIYIYMHVYTCMTGNTTVSDRFSLNVPVIYGLFVPPMSDVLRSIYTASTCFSRCRSKVSNTGGLALDTAGK